MIGFRKKLYNIYAVFEKRIVPNLSYSQEIYEEIIRSNVRQGDVWLDLGCGHHLLPPWKLKQEIELVKIPGSIIGLDYEMSSLQKHKTINSKVRGDISKLPFRNQSFDLITSNMVFEHLKHPESQLAEIHRILKPGGMLVFHTPNANGYLTKMAKITPGIITSKILYILFYIYYKDVKRKIFFPPSLESILQMKLMAWPKRLAIK